MLHGRKREAIRNRPGLSNVYQSTTALGRASMHGVRGTTVRLVAVAIVTVVGAGACAFAPSQPSASGANPVSVSATVGTGASGPPDPTTTKTPVPPTPEPSKTTQKPKPKPKPKPAGCPTGERQRDVETALADLGSFGPITVDGKQSPQDCKTIKTFQQRFGISPA
ncbi:MAG TPA: hypothetical protein VGP16_24695, partial [Asanoa sp.]|nr:hypothetical protein [Asanoa sp.]